MGSLTISSLVVVIVLCGAALGVAAQRLLPDNDPGEHAKEIVKPSMGLIATLAALVLGLVIATAKSSYDDKSNQLRQITALIITLDNVLIQYGPETTPLRKELRAGVDHLADRIWIDDTAAARGPFRPSADILTFLSQIAHLDPKDDNQRALKGRIIQALDDISKARLLLYAQAGSSIQLPFLVVLVFWLAALFASFTLFVRVHTISAIALVVCAVSIGGAIFLLLELDSPFVGLMQIPSSVLRSALGPV